MAFQSPHRLIIRMEDRMDLISYFNHIHTLYMGTPYSNTVTTLIDVLRYLLLDRAIGRVDSTFVREIQSFRNAYDNVMQITRDDRLTRSRLLEFIGRSILTTLAVIEDTLINEAHQETIPENEIALFQRVNDDLNFTIRANYISNIPLGRRTRNDLIDRYNQHKQDLTNLVLRYPTFDHPMVVAYIKLAYIFKLLDNTIFV